MGMALAGLGAVIFVVLAIVLTISIFYFLTLYKAMSRVSPRNRLMEPGLVWLSIVPILNVVWSFFNAIRVPGSLKNEFVDRGMDDGSDYGKGVGLAGAVITVVQIALGCVAGAAGGAMAARDPFNQPQPQGFAAIDILSNILNLANLVLVIIFWVKIAGYSNRLANAPAYDRGRDDHDDYRRRDDDFPPRRDGDGPSDSYRQDDRDRIR